MSKPKSAIKKGRKRSNILKDLEFKTIEFLCKIMPSWITSDILTGIGMFGSILIAGGLYMATQDRLYLGLSILGFIVQWFGDSLDGRLAYFRNIPRKWYGWALDISADWLSICVIGFGFYYYFEDYKFVAFVFVFTYGWSMINSLLKYKITDKYQIDTFGMGPTELRILICIFLILEYFYPITLLAFGAVGSGILMLINLWDLTKVLQFGNERDAQEKAAKLG